MCFVVVWYRKQCYSLTIFKLPVEMFLSDSSVQGSLNGLKAPGQSSALGPYLHNQIIIIVTPL